MIHASLFSGIGGFDLAADRMGWQNVFNCEIDPFCRKVLAYHFPDAKQYEDVKTTDFTIYRGHIDVLTGGFPCQPFSLAGKRKGSDDNRYLWPEMLRAIREIEPRWVVGENVFGIVNWSDGMVFEQVQSDLEDAGYEVQPYIIPACAVDAPHRRDRVWFVAHRRDAGLEILQRERAISIRESSILADTRCNGGREIYEEVESKESARKEPISVSCKRNTAYSISERLERENESRSKEEGMWECLRRDSTRCDISDFSKFPTQSPVCGGDDGFSDRLDACPVPEWLKVNKQWRFSSWWRKESIKAYGNAVVPQIPYLIFKTIEQYETL
jgi:DNA (cytosine-5)-methyltransferase 1